jgi:hypothetical protein
MPQYLSPIPNVEQPSTIATVAAATAKTSATVATADGSDAATTQALANALKVEVNKVIADLTSLYTAVAAQRTAVNAAVAAQIARGDIAAS